MGKSKMPSEVTVRMGNQIADMLDRIGTFFQPGVKLTLLARTVGNPEADLLVTSDDLDEVRAAIERSQAREEVKL